MSMADSVFKKWLPHNKAKRSNIERLKILLDSAPGEYLAWSRGSDDLLYSPGFSRLFNKDGILSPDDIETCLEPFDAASFQTLFSAYKKDPRPRDLVVQTLKGRYLELSFRWGESDHYRHHVIWGRDITQIHKNHLITKDKAEDHSQEVLKLQNILNALPQPIWIRQSDGTLSWCNHAYAELFNKKIAEIISSQKNILVKPEGQKDKTDTKQIAKKALETGQIQELKGHGVIEGQRHTLNLFEKPYPNLDITIGLCENITWQEEVELKNDRTVNAYHAIFSTLQSAVALYNSNQQLEYYNSAFSQLWQLDESWLNQKPKLGDILEKLRETRRLPEQADFRAYKKQWIDMFTKLINSHSDMLVLPDGTVLRTQVIPNPSGGLGHIFEDVTSNLELESSYNTLMAVQKETIDNLSEGVVVYGHDGRLKLWNHTFQKFWNLNPEDLEGEPHISKIFDRTKEFFEPEQWKKRRAYVMNLFENRIEDHGHIKRNDNKVYNFASVLLPDGGTLLTYTDVTDSIRIEEALREKNSALEAAEQLKTDFLAKISYQLRTPLSAIIGFNDILDQEYFGSLNDKQKEYTKGMREAGSNLQSLIDDILDLTSLEAGVICLETEKVKVHPLLETIQENTQKWANEKQIKIDLKCPKNIGSLNIDAKRIKHAITHLIRNAINFTPEKQTITIQAKKQTDTLSIKVIDQGAGIDQDSIDEVFKPFRQNEEISGGAGLGLTIVKNIVELHSGSIHIESTKGEGTTISLNFPT